MDEDKKHQLTSELLKFFDGNTKKEIADKEYFLTLYNKFLQEDAHIDWNSWKHIGEDVQKQSTDLPPFDESRRDVLNKLAVIKLNGGLGTTMGCNEAKSFIKLIDPYTFLDIAIKQQAVLNEKHNCSIPLYLMNSFYTEDQSREKLHQCGYDWVKTFEQSKCPRILKNTYLPFDDNQDGWYPPGHGNIFASLVNTGTLDKLLEEGREVLFVSNIDNTGATLDLSIAQFMLDQQLEYVMECTEKTQSDIKGGTLIEINGRFMHLEIPQVPPKHLDDFCSTRVFKIFNTNNIWVNLRAVKKYMPNITSEIIVNHKKVNGNDVIQLETSIGGCIKNFEKAYCLHVPRSRFRPVKKVEDLVVMSSDCFRLTKDFHLDQVAKTLPHLNLGPFYSTIGKMKERMPNVPSLKDCTYLAVEGDVSFGKNVIIKGDVMLINTFDLPVKVPDNSEYINTQIIFGSPQEYQ